MAGLPLDDLGLLATTSGVERESECDGELADLVLVVAQKFS